MIAIILKDHKLNIVKYKNYEDFPPEPESQVVDGRMTHIESQYDLNDPTEKDGIIIDL